MSITRHIVTHRPCRRISEEDTRHNLYPMYLLYVAKSKMFLIQIMLLIDLFCKSCGKQDGL